MKALFLKSEADCFLGVFTDDESLAAKVKDELGDDVEGFSNPNVYTVTERKSEDDPTQTFLYVHYKDNEWFDWTLIFTIIEIVPNNAISVEL